MNVAYLLKKASIAFFLLFCFVVSFSCVGGERIRLRKVKTHVAPRHIHLSARSGSGIYARRYGYGGPMPHYSTKGTLGKSRRYYAARNGNGRRRSTLRTYASQYRNWVDDFRGGRNEPRIDGVGQRKKRKELYPFLKEPPLGAKQKRRNRPHGLSAMQRPRPPNRPNEFNDDYYFPEEAKRAETKYEYENRFQRPKKKRRPDFEGSYSKPDFAWKIPFYDEKPLTFKTRSREPAFSYSSFIQHPSGSALGDDAYDDPENFHSQPVRNKKKKLKKKSNDRKKNKEQFKQFAFENDQAIDSYPSHLSTDEYELPAKTYKKRNRPNSVAEEDGDDFVPSPSYAKPRPQVNGLFSTDSDYRGSQNTYLGNQFNPSYSQTWPQVASTTVRPVQYQTDGGFQPQYVSSQYNNFNKDYSTLQKTKAVTTNVQQPTYYSQPDSGYKSIPYSTQISGSQSQSSSNYVSFPGQPASPTLTDITIQKSVPIYDNTETFYSFNNNAYVNSQSSKYYGGGAGEKNYEADASQNFGGRLPTYRSKVGENADSDSEFIRKHQNLYNKGLTGVPVQGDGYAKETVKKDYDIGYGDFQFDENPGS